MKTMPSLMYVSKIAFRIITANVISIGKPVMMPYSSISRAHILDPATFASVKLLVH